MLDGDNRIRLIIAGLVLAAIAVGYMIFSQRFSANNTQVANNTNRTVQQITPTPTLTITPTVTPSPAPATLGESSDSSTKGGLPTTKGGLPNTGVSSLPNTGFPAGLVAIFSASAAIAGYFLRKYPN